MSLLQGWEPTPHCFRVHCKNRVDIWTALSFRRGLVRPCGVDNSGQNHPHVFIRRFPSTKTFLFSGFSSNLPSWRGQCETSGRKLAEVVVDASVLRPNIEPRGPNLTYTIVLLLWPLSIIRMGAYFYPLGAAWLNCCAPVTWSDGGRVAADRGRGTLSQHLKSFEGFRIRYCSESSTQA